MATATDAVTITKQGETCISISLLRSKAGLTVEVQALPRVEDFMKKLGGGEREEVELKGRYWLPVSKDAPPLLAYVSQPLERCCLEDGTIIDLGALGQPLLVVNDPRKSMSRDVINLSYLRLVGISEGRGVSFNVAGVYSIDALKRIRDKMSLAARKFYIDYLRPVDFNVQISLQELQH